MSIKCNYISKEKFESLELGESVLVRFMGKGTIISEPFFKDGTNENGKSIQMGNIKIEFGTGPWEGKTLHIARQQIASSDWGLKAYRK